MILSRLKYPGEGTAYFARSGSLTPEVMHRSVTRDAVADGSGPRFGRRHAVVRAVDVYELLWPFLTRDEVRLVLFDYESAASRGTRRLSYTPDDRTAPVPVLVDGRPEVTRRSASSWQVAMRLRVQA